MSDYTRQEVERLSDARMGRAPLTTHEVTRVFRGDRAAVLAWFAGKPNAFMPDFAPHMVEQAFGPNEQVEVGFAFPRDRQDSFLVHDVALDEILEFRLLDVTPDGRSRIVPA